MTAAVAVVGALLLSGCGFTGPRPSTQYITPPETTGGLSSEPFPARQIAVARRSNNLFAIFPARPGTKRCGIPEGGVHFKPLAGRCTTSVHTSPTYTPGAAVTFIETWKFPCRRIDDCVNGRTYRHVWQVILDPRLRVVETPQSGSTAPQYYK